LIKHEEIQSQKKKKKEAQSISSMAELHYPFCQGEFRLLSQVMSEVVEFHCSPYSATILLSTPQQGKLTIKADLIFEEYSIAPAMISL
jgi:hypothetical protein